MVGIGLVLAPLLLLYQLGTLYVPLFSNGTWQILTDPASSAYNPMWGPLLLSEVAANMLFTCAWLYLIYTFFTKKRVFPVLYIGLTFSKIALIVLDAVALSAAMSDVPVFDQATVHQLVKLLIAAGIWVPYMLRSKRVKATFVNGRGSSLSVAAG